MFGKLTNFKYKRKGWEPLGFYLAYVILLFLSVELVQGFVESFTRSNTFFEYINIEKIVGVLLCVSLAYLIVTKKKLGKSFGNIVLIVLSGSLAVWIGGWLGLIIPSYLTTRK